MHGRRVARRGEGMNAFERLNYGMKKRPFLRRHLSPIYYAWVTGKLPEKKARSVTLPDGTIEIYDAAGNRTAVIV